MSMLIVPFDHDQHFAGAVESLMRVRSAYGVYPPRIDVGDDGADFERWLLEEEALVRLVAEQFGMVIGHGSSTKAHPYLTKQLDKLGIESSAPNGFAEVSKLFVDPLAHKLGAGKALLMAVIEANAEIGYQTALAVIETSTAAINLYKRVGMKPAGEFMGVHGRNFVFVDESH